MYRKKLMLAGACLLLTAVTLASGTLAWLSKSQKAEGAFTALSDFEVAGILSFQDGTAYTGGSILVPVSFDPHASNYIGDMKYVIRYTGVSPAYIRVRVLEQWTDLKSNEILPASFLQYAVEEDGSPAAVSPVPSPYIPAAGGGGETDALTVTGRWADNRAADYCYYYDVPLQPKALAASGEGTGLTVGDGAVELTLFDQMGVNPAPDVDPTATQMGLILEVEAVQPNRYRELWGISSLPF